jgi:AraC-like DNA-binding protein
VQRRDAYPDYAAIKQHQQATWAAGDYAVIGTTLQIVGEHLCEAIDLRAGEHVIDVAAGNGNARRSPLPRTMVVSDRSGADGWLGQFTRFAVAEATAKRAGSEGVLGRLNELMFVEAVRMHLDSLPNEQIGWLAGLRDRHVGRTLTLMHGKPAHPWTIEELAREVGLSRSALADRFMHLVGQPPMHYLAQWRMQMAAGLLSSGGVSIASIARAVGYGSEVAFSRAFKKLVGTGPLPGAGGRARACRAHTAKQY